MINKSISSRLQQWTIDNWQLTMKRQISRLLFLNAFSLAVSIAYCLCSSLLPFYIALTPSAWQFPIAIGALPQTLPPFLSWHKKGAKKGQDYARFARKTWFGKLKLSTLLKVRGRSTNFNFEHRLFLTAFLTSFLAYLPWTKVEKWVVFICLSHNSAQA